MPIDPNISLGVKGLELANPLAQYGQAMQLQTAQRQNEVAQMQLDQLRRDEETLKQIQAKAIEHGGPSDLGEIANAYIKSGNPKFVEFGIGLRQKLDERAQFAQIMGMGAKPAPANALAAPSAQEAPANALVPAPTAPAAPANALAAPPNPMAADVAQLRQRRDALLALGTPQAIAAARALDSDISIASKEPTYHVVPGVGLVEPRGARVVMPSVETPPAEVKEYEYAKKQGYKGSLFDFKRDLAAAGRAPVQPVAPTITTIEDPTAPGKFLQVDARVYKGGGAGAPGVIGGARPSATAEKATVQKAQLSKDLDTAIAELRDITKEGGLIDQSTGSGAGRLVDVAAGFVGQATPGAIATAKLAPIADLALKMVPRFEGPQSDKDTASYKQAAGQLADPSLPSKIRKEAGKTVLRLMENRKGQFVTQGMAAEGTAPTGGVDTSNPLLK